MNRLSRIRTFLARYQAALSVLPALGFIAFSWVEFFTGTKRGFSNGIPATVGLAIIVNVMLLVFLIRTTIQRTAGPGGLAILTAYVLLVLTYCFTALYWHDGTKSNFSQPLSHIDALYVTIGTLSTVGSGTISPGPRRRLQVGTNDRLDGSRDDPVGAGSRLYSPDTLAPQHEQPRPRS